MQICAILFDKDGTLVSFEKTWGPAVGAVIGALANGDPVKLAAQADALQFSIEDLAFLPTSPIIAGSTWHYAPLWAAALGRSDLTELKSEIDALTAIESIRSLTPIGAPGQVVGKLAELGLAVGVATNDLEASARRQIGALGLLDQIDFIVGYDSGYGAKPEPGMVLAFADRLGLLPSSIAVVGDTLHDLAAARAAGAVAVAVLSGPAAREALEPHADFVLEDISGVPGLVARLNA